jgi:hypothetical protein
MRGIRANPRQAEPAARAPAVSTRRGVSRCDASASHDYIPGYCRIRPLVEWEFRNSLRGYLLGCSFDFLGMDFLSINAVVDVVSDMAPSILGERYTSEIILDNERVGTQGQVLTLILSQL